MYIALAVFLVIFSIFLHELGHAYEMQKRGLKIEYISIGLKIGKPWFVYRNDNFFAGTPLYFTPWLVGAAVSISEEELDRASSLPYRDQATIFGAGIWANIFFGIVIAFFALAGEGNINLFDGAYGLTLTIIAVTLIVVWEVRYFISAYIFPFFCVAVLALIVYSMADNPTESVGGPIMIAQQAAEFSVSVWTAFSFAGMISIGIALFNLLPIMPLDGGRIVHAIVSRFSGRLAGYYTHSGLVVLSLFIAFIFLNDILRLFR